MARSKWKTTHKDLTLRSGFEKKVASYLDSKKVKYTYEEDKIPYTEPATDRKYTPDFKLPNGIYIECKGRFTPADRRKMALIVEQHPDLDVRMVFMRDNTLSKSSKTTYTAWCAARGINAIVSSNGEIPKEWLKASRKASSKTTKDKD